MSKFSFFMWCCWGAFLLSAAAALLIPVAIIIAPIALIAVIAYIVV